MFTPQTCHVSHVTCHVSRVTCQVSRVTCHMSRVIYLFIFLIYFFFFFGQSVEAYRLRVCYQRGLPRLVFKHTVYIGKSYFWQLQSFLGPPSPNNRNLDGSIFGWLVVCSFGSRDSLHCSFPPNPSKLSWDQTRPDQIKLLKNHGSNGRVQIDQSKQTGLNRQFQKKWVQMGGSNIYVQIGESK